VSVSGLPAGESKDEHAANEVAMKAIPRAATDARPTKRR